MSVQSAMEEDDNVRALPYQDTLERGSALKMLSVSYSPLSDAIFDNGTTLFLNHRTVIAQPISLGSANDYVYVTGDVTARVDGGGGIDSLNIDHSPSSGRAFPLSSYVINWGEGGVSGRIYNGGLAPKPVSFEFTNFDKLSLTAGSGRNDFYVVGKPAPGMGSMSINGNQGYLDADFSASSNTEFRVQPDGSIISDYGSFSNFRNFRLDLGDGTNLITTGNYNDRIFAGYGQSIIDTGDGNDTVSSIGLNDTISLGDGDGDLWIGEYGTSVQSLSFVVDGSSAKLFNNLSIASVEEVRFYSGSGSDTFNIKGASATIFAGEGTDSISISYAGLTSNFSSSMYVGSGLDGSWHGRVGGGGLNSSSMYTTFAEVEHAKITFDDSDNYVSVGAGASLLGATLKLYGGRHGRGF